MALLADVIVMSRQAELGPVDPRKGAVSFEDIMGYFDFARNSLAVKDSEYLTRILIELSNKISPLTIGELYRSHGQMEGIIINSTVLSNLDNT